MKKPIILIGGTAGVGKTTLANKLLHQLQIDHKLGTGFIREILRTQTSMHENPELFSYTFTGRSFLRNFIKQAQLIQPAVQKCIERAKREGTSLIIEGNHLIPGLYKLKDVDKFIILKVSNEKHHIQQVNGNTHINRKISKEDFRNIRIIQKYILEEARKKSTEVIESNSKDIEIFTLINKQLNPRT